MLEQAYKVNPEEFGQPFGTAGAPTEKGWRVVNPDPWYFRNNLVADKIQTVEGYSDKDYYMDCTKVKLLCDIDKQMPNASPGQLHAELLSRYLDTQNIIIREKEIFVGSWGNDQHAILYDALSDNWFAFQEFYDYGKAYYWKDGEKLKVTKKIYDDVKALCEKVNLVFAIKPYLTDTHYRMYTETGMRFWEISGATGFRGNPDHRWYMSHGLRKLVEMMGETVKRLEKEMTEATGSEYCKISHRVDDCKASIRCAESVIRWIKRHGQVAKDLAVKESNPKERERLERIASNCAWISENPPRDFWEMMQLHWLSFMAHYLIEHTCHSVTFRPDQEWFPWFDKSVLKEKTVSKDQAADIIAFYFMKYHEVGLLAQLENFRKTGMGARDFSVITVGGQKADGSDATNELTMLMLDVIDGYRFHFPDVKVRWHSKFDKKNLDRVVEIMRTGMGSPSLRNDNTAIPEMLHHYGSMTIEEARSWAVVGCNTPGITVNSKGSHRRSARTNNVLKTVELTLFNGKDPEPGHEWISSRESGDPTTFKTFDEFYSAWLKQWDWLVRTGMNIFNVCDEFFQNMIRRPFLSILYRRCVEEGHDVMHLDVPWLSFIGAPGWVDTVDSLIGIKSLIYDKKKYKMEDLIKALEADWEGYEDMRQDFKSAPKFGNNDDYADDLFGKAVHDVTEIGRQIKDLRDEPAGYVNGLVVTHMYHLAPYTGALPNGRKRGEALCDGGINPHAEFDKGGPWDRMASALKVDQSQFKAWIYNQKFDYNTVAGESGLDKMIDYTLSGLEGGMDQLQYNLVSREVLTDAKKQPEKYPFLAVRISGYSAYFTSLPEYVQDAVIDRVDHEL
jgi:pyruvate-formate lyase